MDEKQFDRLIKTLEKITEGGNSRPSGLEGLTMAVIGGSPVDKESLCDVIERSSNSIVEALDKLTEAVQELSPEEK